MHWIAAIILVLALLAILQLRRCCTLPRRYRGAVHGPICARCGYACTGRPICPECGDDVTRRGPITPAIAMHSRPGNTSIVICSVFLVIVTCSTLWIVGQRLEVAFWPSARASPARMATMEQSFDFISLRPRVRDASFALNILQRTIDFQTNSGASRLASGITLFALTPAKTPLKALWYRSGSLRVHPGSNTLAYIIINLETGQTVVHDAQHIPVATYPSPVPEAFDELARVAPIDRTIPLESDSLELARSLFNELCATVMPNGLPLVWSPLTSTRNQSVEMFGGVSSLSAHPTTDGPPPPLPMQLWRIAVILLAPVLLAILILRVTKARARYTDWVSPDPATPSPMIP